MKKMLIHLILFIFYGFEIFAIDLEINYRIKLYSLCASPEDEIFRDNYFIATIKDNYELLIHENLDSNKKSTSILLDKINIIINAIKHNNGKIFIYSDLDIQFFQPTAPILINMLQKNDIVFIKDRINNKISLSFFAAVGSDKVLQLWQEIKKYVQENPKMDYQLIATNLLSRNSYINWSYLPKNFYNGNSTQSINLSKIILYHPSHIKHMHKINQFDDIFTEFYKAKGINEK